MSQNFQNKIVLITGASSGIGEATAYEFAEQGATIALLARRTDKLIQVQKNILNKNGKAHIYTCDVTDKEMLNKTVTQINQEIGLVDIVVANAGFGVSAKFEQSTLEDYQRQFNTNVFGVISTLYATLNNIKATKGNIVLIGSLASYVTLPRISAYCMSKFSIRALAECLRIELMPYGIHVTLISPGYVKTEIRHVDNQGIYHPEANDPVPKWLRISASAAAKKIVQAVHKKKFEQIVTWHAYVIIKLYFLCHTCVRKIVAWVFK